MRFRLYMALACAAPLPGCGGDASHGETYAMPDTQVRQMLLDTDAPIQVLGAQAVDWKTSEQGDDTVLWTVLGDTGRPLIRFAAKIVPVEGGTRIDVDVLAPEGSQAEKVTKRLAENPTIRDLYHVAMTEEIDAKLEHRGFDASRIAVATMRAASANMKSISGSLDEAVKAERRREQQNVARAYRDEGKARFGNYGEDGTGPKRFGAPMDNPNLR